MVVMGLILWAFVWVAIAFWPARVARNKGHSFWGFFIMSIIFFFGALLLAYVVDDRKATKPSK